jgi:hypothetical protein
LSDPRNRPDVPVSPTPRGAIPDYIRPLAPDYARPHYFYLTDNQAMFNYFQLFFGDLKRFLQPIENQRDAPHFDSVTN